MRLISRVFSARRINDALFFAGAVLVMSSLVWQQQISAGQLHERQIALLMQLAGFLFFLAYLCMTIWRRGRSET